MRSGCYWKFAPKGSRFRLELHLVRERGYRYDGDDPDGETQAKLDSGEYVAFNSSVVVYLDGEEIAADHLGGSVYGADDFREFYTAHRDADPLNRNSSIMRAARGEKTAICHYFPSMVGEAVRMAREHVRDMAIPPRIRENA